MSGAAPVLLLVGVLILIVLGWWIAVYNRLVKLRQLITNSWSNVETELQRRYDLIPRLVETVKGYAAHERAVLDLVIRARSAAQMTNGEDPAVQEQTEKELVVGLRRMLALAEAYPDLRASAHFLELQQELTHTEDRIQLARRIYNANVRDLNILVESIPSRFVASAVGVTQARFFEIEPVVAEAPAVDLA